MGYLSNVLLLSVVLALPLSAGARSKQESAEAKKAFREGSRLFAAKDYTAALEAFQRADFLKPHFLLKCNIARCQERMGKMVEAAESYRKCLDGGARKRRRMARKVMHALSKVEAKISWVEVTSPGKGGTVFINGLDKGPAPMKVPLNPGTTVIEVRREGATPAGGTITTSGGESQVLELIPKDLPKPKPKVVVAPPPPPPPPPPKPTRLSQWWFWSAAAITAGLAAAAGVIGVQALGKKSDYEDNPTRDGYNEAKDKRLLANILWGATAAAAAGTTTLFFFTDFRFGKKHDEPDDDVAFGVGLQGTF